MTDRIEALKRVLAAAESVAKETSLATATDVASVAKLIGEMELREEHREVQAKSLDLIALKDEVFFFGTDNQSGGHYLFDVWFNSYRGASNGPLPWEQIDTKLAPYIGTEPHRRSTYDNGRQTQGIAALHHKDGWTALSFWDRSVDERMGCNSNFFWKGTHTFEEMLEQFRKVYPTIVARYPFPIVPVVP